MYVGMYVCRYVCCILCFISCIFYLPDGSQAYAVGLVAAGIPKDDSGTALPLPGTSLTSQLAQMLPSAVADTLTLNEVCMKSSTPYIYRGVRRNRTGSASVCVSDVKII